MSYMTFRIAKKKDLTIQGAFRKFPLSKTSQLYKKAQQMFTAYLNAVDFGGFKLRLVDGKALITYLNKNCPKGVATLSSTGRLGVNIGRSSYVVTSTTSEDETLVTVFSQALSQVFGLPPYPILSGLSKKESK